MSEISVLAQDVTKTGTDRSNYSVEFVQLQNYVSDIGTKNFNGVSLYLEIIIPSLLAMTEQITMAIQSARKL